MMAKVKPENTIRFAWWGAEEDGLIGSRGLRRRVSIRPSETGSRMYMNYDMVGSPNYVFSWSTTATSRTPSARLRVPPGSKAIEDVYEAVLHAHVGSPYEDTEFSGRSRLRGRSSHVGIPSGGLFTGAEGIKTAAAAAIWGGHGGCAVRPVLPPRVRHVRELQTATRSRSTAT